VSPFPIGAVPREISPSGLKIERALLLLGRPGLGAVGVLHGSFEAGVPQKILDDADIVIRALGISSISILFDINSEDREDHK